MINTHFSDELKQKARAKGRYNAKSGKHAIDRTIVKFTEVHKYTWLRELKFKSKLGISFSEKLSILKDTLCQR